jgi:SAM-dependent methyltransferase
MGGRCDGLTSILFDFDGNAGVSSGHYFHQDLLVARYIFQENPRNHFDFGSRVDGFVAHLATFRNVTLLDIRGLEIAGHPQIQFKTCDITKLDEENIADSLSCLHTIEHIGLGRYGDDIDPNGHILAFNNLLRFLKPGGVFYISFPISSTSKVFFNRERIFRPTEILDWSSIPFVIENFDFVDDNGKLHLSQDFQTQLPDLDYGCGIFKIRKN